LVRGQEGGYFLADGGQRTVLDFDEPRFVCHVNPIASHRDLATGERAGIKLFQLAVERSFHVADDGME
jgi:hypothetical protein